jgi:hypothetical protein
VADATDNFMSTHTLTDELITEALLAGNGLLSNAARYLSDRLGRPISRSTVAMRVEASRALQAVQQIAEERGWAAAIEASQERRRQRRSAAMRASWARRRGQTDGADAALDTLDAPNAHARRRASWGPTPATVQAARDRRLCMARTRKGFPCVRRVVPGKCRCPNHGGLSTGPKTAEGKARIAAAQRARWARYREGRGEHPHQRGDAAT